MINGPITKESFSLQSGSYAKVDVFKISPQGVKIDIVTQPDMVSRDLKEKPLNAENLDGFGQTLMEFIDSRADKGKILFAFNGVQGNFWTAESGVIINGHLIMKPKGVKALFQDEYKPLNGHFWVFSFDKNNPGLFEVDIENGELPSGFNIQNGLLGPPLIQNGINVIDKLKFNQRPEREGNDLNWQSRGQRMSMSAIGYTNDGKLIRLSLIGDPNDSTHPEPTIDDVAVQLQRQGVVDAILLGSSADVQTYYRDENGVTSSISAPARAGSMISKFFPKGRPLASYVVISENSQQQLAEQEAGSTPYQPFSRRAFLFGSLSLLLTKGVIGEAQETGGRQTSASGSEQQPSEYINRNFLNKPVWPTPQERTRFAGQSKNNNPIGAEASGKAPLDWLSLTDHIQVTFVKRGSQPENFLFPSHQSPANKDTIYYFTLPEDITVAETLGLIQNIRALPFSNPHINFPHLPEQFKKAALFLARYHKTNMTEQKELAIGLIYGMGEVLASGKAIEHTPLLSDIAGQELAIERQEVLEWLGIEPNQLDDMQGIIAKATSLAIEGVQISMEALSLERGEKLLQRSLSTDGGMNYSNKQIIQAMAKKGTDMVPATFNIKALKREIEETKEKFGADSPQAAKAQQKAIRSVMALITSLPGWLGGSEEMPLNETVLEGFPKYGELRHYLDCLGRSALSARFLQELGIEFFAGTTFEHIFLIAHLADKSYIFVDPSGDLEDSVGSIPDDIGKDSSGTIWNLNGINGAYRVRIDPWRQGILSSFY
jgi:hypothetical protein